MSDSLTAWTAACQAFLSFTVSWSLLKLISTESVMPSNHLILCRPLFLPSVFPSIRVFSNESALRIRWPKYWSFNFSISLSNEYSGLISFRVDWFDLVCVCLVAQSCLTLCESMEGSTPCSSVKGIVYFIDLFQFSSVAQSCPTLRDPMNWACQAFLSITTPGVHSDSRPSSQ